MALEIERKFLVRNELWREHVLSQSRLVQGYLARGNDKGGPTIRVRIGGGRAWLNIKGAASAIRRPEFEYEIPLQDAQQILEELAERPHIEKTRYRVQCGGHVWDLDLFQGENAGLVVAEVELGSEQEQFEMPSWAGEEVSGDRRYRNASLVDHPYSRW
jgi:adenylate cyclase